MKTITFLLPVRIDNDDRLDNVNTCLKYLTTNYPESEIILVEDDETMKCKKFEDVYRIRYHFRQNNKSFSRAKNINYGLQMASNVFFAVWDVDCLIHPEQMKQANKILSERKIHIVLPHNEIFVNLKGSLKKKIADTLKLEEVPHFKKLPKTSPSKNMEIYPIPSGVVVFNRNSLLRIGGFNKKMISYGWEDIEVLKRAEKLGMYYFSLSFGNIIHLDHERGKDSRVNEQYEKNKSEFLKVKSMSKTQLTTYINEELSLDKEMYALDYAFLKKINRTNRKSLSLAKFYINRMMRKVNTNKLPVNF